MSLLNSINLNHYPFILTILRQPPGDNSHPKASHLAMCTAACAGEICMNIEKLVADKDNAVAKGRALLLSLKNVSGRWRA